MAVEFAREPQFQKVVAGRTDVCLPGLLLEFAADAYPDVDVLACLAEIDRLGGLAKDRLMRRAGAGDLSCRLAELSRLLYQDEGFRGNRDDYYDPRNSYLNEVLERRCGIPITLGIVYMAVAWRAGLPMQGFAMPGHFVVGCPTCRGPLFVDPFAEGEVLDRQACQERIEQLTGKPGVVEEEHFRAARPREIAVRVLRNLKTSYAMRNEWLAMVSVQKRLTLLVPDSAEERRDLGLVYLRNGRAQRALEILEDYVRRCGTDQAQEVKPYLRSARRMVAELN
jgi:regulator of sirC expression with transglutaminase-like and TPR domain